MDRLSLCVLIGKIDVRSRCGKTNPINTPHFVVIIGDVKQEWSQGKDKTKDGVSIAARTRETIHVATLSGRLFEQFVNMLICLFLRK